MYKLFELSPNTKLEIREVADASAVMVGLDQYNRSKIPGTIEVIYTGRGRDGRFLTGIDEESYELAMMEANAKTQPEMNKVAEMKAKTKTLRERLQVMMGVKDLSATSSHWETFKVPLHKIRHLDLSQAHNVVIANMLRAHNVVMPDLSDAGNPKYFRTKFYYHSELMENERKTANTQPLDKARASLYNMFEAKDLKLPMIAQILFPQADNLEHLGYTTIYQQVKFHLESAKTMDNAREFNSYALMDMKELTIRLLFRKASNRGLIKTVKNEYNFNGKKLGRNIETAVKILGSPEGEATILDMQEALSRTEIKSNVIENA